MTQLKTYRTKKILAVLISGKAGVGKTTLAETLLDNLEKLNGLVVVKLGFADPIKQMAKSEFGWNGLKDDRGRKLLQDIGRTGRSYDENVWVRKTLERIESNPIHLPHIVFIDDWRFPNEVTFIENNLLYDVLKVRVECPSREMLKGAPEYNDVSETSLESGYDYLHKIVNPYYAVVVDNEQTLEDLYMCAVNLTDYIKNNYLVQEVENA